MIFPFRLFHDGMPLYDAASSLSIQGRYFYSRPASDVDRLIASDVAASSLAARPSYEVSPQFHAADFIARAALMP